MSWFRPSREQRGDDRFLNAKVALFSLGAVVALIGIATDIGWLVNIAIGILIVGFALRFLKTRDADPPPTE